MPEINNHAKILFRFHSNIFDREQVETMWAETVDAEQGLYRIDNIPFYASIALSDIIFAEFDEQEEMLTYRYTATYSGNSTIQVVLLDKAGDIESIRKTFELLGCDSEGMKDYFSMDIPAAVDYKPVKVILQKLADDGVIDYAEPVLSENHQY